MNHTPTDKSAEALPEPLGYMSPGDIEHIQSRTEQYRGRNYNIKATVFLDRGFSEGSATESVFTAEQVRAILADRTARAAAQVQSVGDVDTPYLQGIVQRIIKGAYAQEGHEYCRENYEELLAHIDSLLAARPSAAPDDDMLHFNATRLRNVARLVGLENAVPAEDAVLDGARGAVLGQIARVLRERAAQVAECQPCNGMGIQDGSGELCATCDGGGEAGYHATREAFDAKMRDPLHKALTERATTQKAAPVSPVGAVDDHSMPVDMSEAKRCIVQLRGRVDALLAWSSATPTAVTAPDLSARDAALGEIEELASKGVSYGLLADDICGQILERTKVLRAEQASKNAAVRENFIIQKSGAPMPHWEDEGTHRTLESAQKALPYHAKGTRQPLRVMRRAEEIVMDDAAIRALHSQPKGDNNG